MKKNTDYAALKQDQLKLYRKIREEVGNMPIISKEHREDTHIAIGIARARLVQLLKHQGGYDKVEPLKNMPAIDSIDLTYRHPYTVDCYAEKYHPDSNGHVVIDRLVVDIFRSLPWGSKLSQKKERLVPLLPDYEIQQNSQATVGVGRTKFLRSDYPTDYSVLRRGLRKKKELICDHYNLDSSRYVEVLELQLFNRPLERERKMFEHRVKKNQLMLHDDELLNLLGCQNHHIINEFSLQKNAA